MASGEDLVFALCHEVGNLVGAIRLNADMIDDDASALELATASVEIDDASARIRSWLALVRPLLDGEPGGLPGVTPEALLCGVAEALEEYGGRGVSIEVDSGASLPGVQGRPETLHHLLLTLGLHAVEEARPRGRVHLGASRLGDRVAVFVEDDGAEDPSLQDGADAYLTGRGLALATAEFILARIGGSALATRENAQTRVTLLLPPL
jgi:nitrogen-specific signal transduction histidine kinase